MPFVFLFSLSHVFTPTITSNSLLRSPARGAPRDAPRGVASADEKPQRRKRRKAAKQPHHLPAGAHRRHRGLCRRVRARGRGQRRRGPGRARWRVVCLPCCVCFAAERARRWRRESGKGVLDWSSHQPQPQPQQKKKTAPSSTAPRGSEKETKEKTLPVLLLFL